MAYLCASIIGLGQNAGRSRVLHLPVNQVRYVVLKATPATAPLAESYDAKNARLNRPLSPHLTIYKPQLTSMLSITHRITGMAISAYAVAIAAGAFMPWDFPQMIAAIQDQHLSDATIYSSKMVLAFPVAYHLSNGIRHLVWDLGKALSIKKVYVTGYAMLGVTAALTAFLASL